MDPRLESIELNTRRHFLRQSAAGIGGIALNCLLENEASSNEKSTGASTEISTQPHFKPKAKRVIYLHMTGSPPNLELFDYKPELIKHSEENCPDQFLKGKKFAFTSGTPSGTERPRACSFFSAWGCLVNRPLASRPLLIFILSIQFAILPPLCMYTWKFKKNPYANI